MRPLFRAVAVDEIEHLSLPLFFGVGERFGRRVSDKSGTTVLVFFFFFSIPRFCFSIFLIRLARTGREGRE